jgi:hypothetical protein
MDLSFTGQKWYGEVLHNFENSDWPLLWSSGQSSWLQIQRSGFDSQCYQIFWVVGLEQSPLSLVSTVEELLGRNSSGSGPENQGSVTLTTWHPLSAKFGTNFANKQRSLGRYSLLTDSGMELSLVLDWQNRCYKQEMFEILSRDRVRIDGDWIGNSIYCPIPECNWKLQLRSHYYTHFTIH